MKFENLLNSVAGSREGEFRPSPDQDVSEEELNAAFVADKMNPSRLYEPEKKEIKKIEGENSNDVFLFELNNGEKIIFKPASGESFTPGDGMNGTLYKRERAAYLADVFFDFDLVPPTVIREINGEIGSAQSFIENAKYQWELEESDKKKILERMKEVKVFGILINNFDRRGTNFLFTKEGGTVLPHVIDNGCSFGKYGPIYRPDDPLFNEELPEDLVKKISDFLDDKDAQENLRKLLLELLLGADVERFFKRVERIGGEIVRSGRLSFEVFREAEDS